MQRIMIVGSGGAGKSTFARALGAKLSLPVYHLDALLWRPGWVMTPHDEELAIIQDLAAQDSWIIDGNYGGATSAPRLSRADTVILLDLPRTICLLRAVRRWITYRNRTRPDMAPDCPERLSLEYLKWIWDYPSVHRQRMLQRIADQGGRLEFIRLRSPRAVRTFLSP